MNETVEIRVLIADDHAILREGIRSLLERQDGVRVLGEASNGREAVELTSALHPDVVLMDMAMPEMNGLEATLQIKKLYPNVQVLILTQHDDREYIDPALKAGASGYVLKRSGGREVVNAIRAVFQHGVFLEPSVARQVLNSLAQPELAAKEAEPALTEREREVLSWIVKGKSNKEIAAVLNISPKTVSVHRSNLMIKLGVRSEIELLRYAAQRGIVKLDP
jgi:DNA-binding NarL/FixJ family response regulator